MCIRDRLGGGGSTTAYTVEIAKKGIRNLLRHTGICEGDLEISEPFNLDMPDQRCYIFSETTGLLEHCIDLGDPVKKGQLVAKVHNIERTGVEPVEYFAEIDGIYTGRHYPGLVVNGDFLGLVAVPV